jgi:hypothetical protein
MVSPALTWLKKAVPEPVTVVPLALLETVPVSVICFTTVIWRDTAKLAVAVTSALMVTLQVDNAPQAAKFQPVKTEPGSGVAVSCTTTVPLLGYTSLQDVPQSMPSP